MNQTIAAPSIEPNCSRFSSADWPEADRLEAVVDIYGRNILRYEIEPDGDSPLQMEATLRTFPGLALAHATCSGTRAHRTPQHVFNDDLILNVTLSGGRVLYQRGREAVVGAGEAIMTTGAETGRAKMLASRIVAFRIPAKAIAPLVPDLGDRVALPIRRDTEALRLLIHYANILQDDHAMASPELQRISVTHVHDLVALTLGATRDAAEVAKLRGARAARLHAIKADITDNLGGDLSVATVAARHRLPVRYVQRLFEEDGTTFTAFLLAQRLAFAHRLLTNPRSANLKISAVALDAGFGNMSYFNDSFRRRYGLSPSDLRAQSAQRH